MPTLEAGQLKIHYEEAGAGEPLVLLHGLGSNSHSWRHQLTGLSQRFRVIAWDAPGYGSSDALASIAAEKITMRDFAEVLAAFLDELKISEAHILGHSMGGVLAFEFYRQYPERVLSLTLADTNRGGGARPAAERAVILERRLEAIATLSPTQIASQRAPSLLSNHADPLLLSEVESIYAQIRPEGYRLATLALDRANHNDLLPQIKVPTLVICGSDDTVTPLKESEILAQNILNAKLEVIEKAGHSSNQEQPEIFNEIVVRFLQNNRGQNRGQSSLQQKIEFENNREQSSLLQNGVLKVGLIGTGSIGTFLLDGIRRGLAGQTAVIALASRCSDKERNQKLAEQYGCVECAAPLELLEYNPDLIIEAATQEAVREYALPIFEGGCDLMVLSAGALADPTFYARLKASLQRNRCKLYIPSGAVGGLDVVRAAALDGLSEVRLITSKKPQALAGAPFFQQTGMEPSQIKERTIIFQGTAQEAVQLFPQNVNVAAILSLAGLGATRTLVEIVADPNLACNKHEIVVKGSFGEMRLNLENVPNPHNPKSSLLACLSPLALLRRLSDPIWIGS